MLHPVPYHTVLIVVFFLLQFRTEQDKKSFCFICSLPNHEFERRAKVSSSIV